MSIKDKSTSVRRTYTGRQTGKKILLAIGVAAAVLSVIGAGTLAYLKTKTEPVDNSFGGSVVDCQVIETFDGEIKSDVSVKNIGDTKSYVRASVVVSWMSEDGKSVTAAIPKDGVHYEIVYADEESEDTLWEKASDGYWYYKESIDPEEVTGLLVKSVYLKESASPPEGFYLSVDVVATAIQAEPGRVCETKWESGVASANGENLTVK